MDFVHYVALGDSLSIDLYPALDAGETDVAVALERVASAGRVAPVGAASLLHRNDDAHWPEELGNDLATRFPGISYTNLAADGATIGDVFGEQLMQLLATDEPTILTLTIGTSDLFSAFANRPKAPLLEHIVRDVAEAFDCLIDAVRQARRNSLLVVSTIYDPSDRTGRIPGVLEESGRLPLRALDLFNTEVRKLAGGTPGLRIAEVYGHFLGHGATAPESERWYWRRSLLEPNARGAHEIRRVWMDAVNAVEIFEGQRR